MSEIIPHYQLDVRELDCQKLGTIHGADYYEVRQILRVSGEERSIVGRASDWPIVYRDARIAELEQRIAELEASQAAIDPPAVAAATGMSSEDAPPPIAKATDDDPRRKCPHCRSRPRASEQEAHMRRHHPSEVKRSQVRVSPTLDLIEPPWRCAQCESSTHTRSLSDPARCMRCATDAIVTNGHLVAA